MSLKIKTIRPLKVYAKAKNVNCDFVPEIKFSGQWLDDCGFGMGKQIHVHVQNGVLTIRPVE